MLVEVPACTIQILPNKQGPKVRSPWPWIAVRLACSGIIQILPDKLYSKGPGLVACVCTFTGIITFDGAFMKVKSKISS